jgi:hypothetical protein
MHGSASSSPPPRRFAGIAPAGGVRASVQRQIESWFGPGGPSPAPHNSRR